MQRNLIKKTNEYPLQTMQGHSIYKVPQGKLLKISLEYNEKKNTIIRIQINGDFFAYPEEAIELLEKKLQNTMLEKNRLLEKIRSIIQEHNIEFIGLTAEGLSQGILMCKL